MDEDKLLYKFPSKEYKIKQRQSAMSEFSEKKKLKKNLILNIFVSIIFVGCGVFSAFEYSAVGVICVLAGVLVGTFQFLFYKYMTREVNSFISTEIYEEKIVNVQYNFWGNSMHKYTLFYDNIEKSSQNLLGDLLFLIKNPSEILAEKVNLKGEKSSFDYKKNVIKLSFVDSKSKYFLINNLFEKINYPKKNYNVIEERDEEDNWR